jgi:protein Mpv17
MIASSRRVGLRRAPLRNGSGTPSNLRFRLHPSHATRRYNGSKPEKAAGTPQSIPGPSWLWLDPIIEPFRAYGRVQQRRPYRTQLISSLVIYFVGDMVAQSIAQPASPPEAQEPAEEAEEAGEKGWVQQWSEERDWARTGQLHPILQVVSLAIPQLQLFFQNPFSYHKGKSSPTYISSSFAHLLTI